MVEGLVISENIALFEEFNINFSNEKNILEYAPDAAAARDLINMEPPDYLIIMERSAEKIKDILTDLLQGKEAEKIPAICIVAEQHSHPRNLLWQLGVKDIITLPISKSELKYQFGQFLNTIADISLDPEEAGMNGKLQDYNLLDLIQILASNKKTGILNLYRSREEARIWFEAGAIKNALYRSFQPLEAILKLTTWTEGDFSITFDENTYENVIETETQEILLAVISHIDDRNRMLDTLPDRSELLLISPEVDMDKMSEENVNFIRYFHSGNTLAGYLDAFDHSDLYLLEIVTDFIDKKYLMTRSEFDTLISEQDMQSEEAGIKKVIKRLFTRKEEPAGGSISSPKLEEIEQMEESLFDDPKIRQFKNHFRRDLLDIDQILKKIKSL